MEKLEGNPSDDFGKILSPKKKIHQYSLMDVAVSMSSCMDLHLLAFLNCIAFMI